MPGESGPYALERSHVRAPVILITDAPTAAVRAAASTLGVVAIFEKPFALKELVEKIRQILRSAGQMFDGALVGALPQAD